MLLILFPINIGVGKVVEESLSRWKAKQEEISGVLKENQRKKKKVAQKNNSVGLPDYAAKIFHYFFLQVRFTINIENFNVTLYHFNLLNMYFKKIW